MPDPVTLARIQAQQVLIQAAQALGSAAVPILNAIRFRPDGKGGELASPFPMTAKLSPEALAAASEPGQWFEAVRPSGDWIALELSEEWRALVRQTVPRPVKRRTVIPPIPAFPARIAPKLWHLDALAGITAPETAARLDRGNPAFQAYRALESARRGKGKNRPDRLLLNEAAQLAGLVESEETCALARQLIRLSQTYLLHPGEDALVAALLSIAAESLGI